MSINRFTSKTVLEILVLVGICYFALVTYTSNIHPVTSGNDIGVEFKTAISIAKGVNPYARITVDDLLVNQKFATLLPTYYYFLLTIAHFTDYVQDDYFEMFRLVIYSAQILGAIFLFKLFKSRGYSALGLIAVSFFLLNRWVIDNVSDLKQDSISLALLLMALYFFDKRTKLSFLIYGFSVAIKQISIFALPIFLITLYQKKLSLKQILVTTAPFLIPTLLPALPFLLADFSSFFYSMIFSLTRAPATNSSIAFGYDKILVVFNPTSYGFLTPLFYLLPRIILFVLLLNIYIQTVLTKFKMSFAIFASFFVFAVFNPVVYDQYMVWVMPFVFYSLADHLALNRE